MHRTQLAADEQQAAVQLLRDQLGQPVWPVHQLDRGTSGVLLFALSAEIASLLGPMFEAGVPDKRYLALVRGWPGDHEGLIDHPLARDPELPSTGQPMLDAQTRWRCRARIELPVATAARHPSTRVALLDLWPPGPATPDPAPPQAHRAPHHWRRHARQGPLNRVLAAHLGLQRLWLHRGRVALPHPVTHELLRITAEPGPEWRQLISVP